MKTFENAAEGREFMKKLSNRHEEFDLWRRMFEVALTGACTLTELPPAAKAEYAAWVADEAVKVLSRRQAEAFKEFDEPAPGGSSPT